MVGFQWGNLYHTSFPQSPGISTEKGMETLEAVGIHSGTILAGYAKAISLGGGERRHEVGREKRKLEKELEGGE